MASNPVPTLTLDGWARTEKDKLVALLTYYFSADTVQDVLHKDNLYSIREDLARGSYEPGKCALIVKSNLEGLLHRHFDHAVVTVSASDTAGWESTLVIVASVSDESGTAQAGYNYAINTGQFSRYLGTIA